MNELLMIRGGEEKSAALPVLELREQDGAERLRKLQVAAAPAGLQQFEQGVGEKRVVVEIGRQMRAPILGGGQKAAVAPQGVTDEIDGGRGGLGQIGPVEHRSEERR